MSLKYINYLATFLSVYQMDINEEFLIEVQHNEPLKEHIQRNHDLDGKSIEEYLRSKMTNVEQSNAFIKLQECFNKVKNTDFIKD